MLYNTSSVAFYFSIAKFPGSIAWENFSGDNFIFSGLVKQACKQSVTNFKNTNAAFIIILAQSSASSLNFNLLTRGKLSDK